ncbi:hypothetical protein BYT27DRAFT_7184165 [Phlegmacium glaucopus]|nr:hypothetical protein BYT27DRAFT_7184165 [Phlegmacium glaucopus]
MRMMPDGEGEVRNVKSDDMDTEIKLGPNFKFNTIVPPSRKGGQEDERGGVNEYRYFEDEDNNADLDHFRNLGLGQWFPFCLIIFVVSPAAAAPPLSKTKPSSSQKNVSTLKTGQDEKEQETDICSDSTSQTSH